MPNTVTLRRDYNFIGFQLKGDGICQGQTRVVIDDAPQLALGYSRVR